MVGRQDVRLEATRDCKRNARAARVRARQLYIYRNSPDWRAGGCSLLRTSPTLAAQLNLGAMRTRVWVSNQLAQLPDCWARDAHGRVYSDA